MATLQVRSAEFSVTRQKAFDDAAKMQAVIADECIKGGKPIPPYELQELIGKGSYGRVYKAKDLSTTQLVAVKIIDIEESDTLDPKRADTYSEFLKEISALKLLRDGGAKNVNYILDALPVAQSMWMITEYCAGGSVATLMRPTSPGGLQEKWIIPILREVAEAIYWVHRQGIIHRDIKCANVLVTEAGGVQLCDFGVAGVIETKFDKRSTVIGTPHWMAPEMFDFSASYGTEVDIWAFGSMVFEIASGLPPNVVQGVTYHQLGNYLKTHTPRLEGDKYSPQLKDLVAFCLADDPTQRPPIEQVQQHPYIFGTSNMYPTDTLAMLVKGYRVWESQGGTRKSLFAPGGAQGPASLDSQLAAQAALANEEWNFSTTIDFDRSVLDNPDSQQAVYDVYGSQVEYEERGPNAGAENKPGVPKVPPAFNADGPRYGGGRGGRRRHPPPKLPAIKAPLEKVFDPDTITNYEDNSRAYYGAPMPPPTATPATSDLPLRDDSLHSTLRESLIDLDASIDLDLGTGPSQFADMETIRAGPNNAAPRASMDYNFSFGGDAAKNNNNNNNNNDNDNSFDGNDDDDYNRPPLSDPADLPNNRRTQEWKFPSMNPPASANPEMSLFSWNNDGETHSAINTPPGSNRGSNNNSISMGRPAVLIHQHTDPVGLPSQGYETPSQGYDLMVPPLQSSNRMSVSSLIDLDESLPDALPEMARPSTANSDAVSMTGSDIGFGNNPFDLERHASLYQPLNSTNREPSIYVSDDSEFAHAVSVAVNNNNNNNQHQQQQQQQQQQYHQHPTGLGLGSSFNPPSFHIHGVHDGSGGSLDMGSNMSMGEPDDEDRRQRRAIESYLNTTGVYTGGDDYVDPLSHQRPFASNNGSSSGSSIYRGDMLGARGRGGFMHGGRRDRGGSFGSRMSRSNGSSGSGSQHVGVAYSTDDGANGGGSINGLTLTSYGGGGNQSGPSRDGSVSDGYGDPEFVDAEEYVATDDLMGDPALSLPPLPGPPSPHVMQGLGSRDEVRDEMKRLLDSFKQHLSFTNTYVAGLPVRRAGVATLRQDTRVEE
ncbi:hypothetical protein SCUCBS95973_004203 [Sporothrix curviconia]|uniref:non-specific serine/threonine protein kinase n=1 Tax=Sporothrix curviconia TaxID=1260050 RepID=A0ABP0BLN9_9PEZI